MTYKTYCSCQITSGDTSRGCYNYPTESTINFTVPSISTLAFGFQRNKSFFPAYSQRFNIVGNLRDLKAVRWASDYQGSNFEFLCLKGSVISFLSPFCHLIPLTILRKVMLVQFSFCVHKGGINPHSSFPLPFQRSLPCILQIIKSIMVASRPF